MNTMPPPRILCFGELLWDVLPTGQYPGGAPFNVACHLKQLGSDALVLSAVGRDALGHELLNCVRQSGLDTRGIARHREFPTGAAHAFLSASGEARYALALDAAWDDIPLTDELRDAARSARALVFGSLAQRSTANRKTLDTLFSYLPTTAERVFDVNLRPPHDNLERVAQLSTRSTLLKMNLDEAARVVTVGAAGTERAAVSARAEVNAERLAEKMATQCFHSAAHIPDICITVGAHGAGLLQNGRWWWERARPVPVHDTIGAGDAFLAGFLAARLDGRDPQYCLAAGCRRGELTVSQHGGNPLSQDGANAR